jgi:hypothetical protein
MTQEKNYINDWYWVEKEDEHLQLCIWGFRMIWCWGCSMEVWRIAFRLECNRNSICRREGLMGDALGVMEAYRRECLWEWRRGWWVSRSLMRGGWVSICRSRIVLVIVVRLIEYLSILNLYVWHFVHAGNWELSGFWHLFQHTKFNSMVHFSGYMI